MRKWDPSIHTETNTNSALLNDSLKGFFSRANPVSLDLQGAFLLTRGGTRQTGGGFVDHVDLLAC